MTEPVARTVKDFCRAYGIGPWKTYQLIREGKLRSVKVGTRTLIPEDSARAWWNSIISASTSDVGSPSTSTSTSVTNIAAHGSTRQRVTN